MEMTFEQYINNPMGIKNAVFSNREMYRELYTKKLDAILVREMGKIKYELYYSKDNYYAYLKIPSEAVANFYYDVVIEFYPTEPSAMNSRDLKDYRVKFYSNDPAFVFTFAHAMIKNKLYVTDLLPKMSKEAIKKVAVEKNPTNQIGYVKSLYFAYLTMKRYGLFNKIKYESEGSKYNKKDLLDKIEHADLKIEQRRVLDADQRQEAKEQKRKEKKEKQKTINNSRFAMKSATSNPYNSNLNTVRKTKSTFRFGSKNNVKQTNKITKTRRSRSF